MKNKIAKIVVICMIIGAYKFAYAPEELHKAKNGGAHEEISKSKNGGAQILWVEGQRGWAESGDSIWTALPYQVIFTLNGDNWGFRPPFGWSEEINFRPGSWVSPNANLQIGGGSSRAGIITMGGAFWADYYLISTDPTPPPYDQGYVYGMYPTASGIRWYNGSTWQTITPGGAAEWTDAGEYLYPADDASAWTQVYESATPSSGYRVAGAYNANIYALLGTNVSGVQGNSNNASGAGVMGIGTGTDGVYGQSDNGSYFGVSGYNSNATGSGVLGLGSGNTSLAWSGSGDGVIGASDAGYGVIGSHYNGSNNNRWGALGTPYWGVYGSSDNASGGGVGGFYTGTGDGIGVYGRSAPADWYGYGGYFEGGYMGVRGVVNPTGSNSYYGVYGYVSGGSGNNYGVRGYASSSNYQYGVYGAASSSSYYGAGVLGAHYYSTGTGVVGLGNGLSTFYTLNAGSGGAFTGDTFGVFGRATTTADGGAGGYFQNGTGAYVYVGLTYGGYNYKVNGSGYVSTIMETREGRKNLFAPEAPEPFIFDLGEGKLVNGKARVYLDPLFLDCIEVSEEHPLKVFVQPKGDCNGVYVKTYNDGFEVIELNNGKSNVSFDYMVIAKWKGYKGDRFPDAPPPLTQVSQKLKEDTKAEKKAEVKTLNVQEIKIEMKKLKEKLNLLEKKLKDVK